VAGRAQPFPRAPPRRSPRHRPPRVATGWRPSAPARRRTLPTLRRGDHDAACGAEIRAVGARAAPAPQTPRRGSHRSRPITLPIPGPSPLRRRPARRHRRPPRRDRPVRAPRSSAACGRARRRGRWWSRPLLEASRPSAHSRARGLADVVVAPPRRSGRSRPVGTAIAPGGAFAAAGAQVVIGCKQPRAPHAPPHGARGARRAHDHGRAPRELAREATPPPRPVPPLAVERHSPWWAVSNATRTRLGALDRSWADKCDVVPKRDEHQPRPRSPPVRTTRPRRPRLSRSSSATCRPARTSVRSRPSGRDPPARAHARGGGSRFGGRHGGAGATCCSSRRAGRVRVDPRPPRIPRCRWCYEPRAGGVVSPRAKRGSGSPSSRR